MKAWRVPLALVVLSVVPMIGGLVRLDAVATGSVKPDDVRFTLAPVVTVVHVIGATLFSLLGAFQFSAELRRRWPRCHRLAGRVLVGAGLATGLSGLWMAARWEIPTPMQGTLLLITRLLVGAVTVTSLLLGVRAIMRRDVASHEAWMIRAYALGLGAGTQVFVLGLPSLFFGEFLGLTRDVLMLAAWALNLAIAEVIIRRAQPRTSFVAAASTGSAALRAS